MVTVIETDNVLEGYSSDKIRGIYSRIKREVLTEDPVQISEDNLVIIKSTFRKGSYEWELYITNGTPVLLEAWGHWQGYAGREIQPKLSNKPAPPESVRWNFLRLTLHKSNPSLEEQIQNIFNDFPRHATKKTT